MKSAILAVVMTAGLLISGTASASNGLYIINNDDTTNLAALAVTGNENALRVIQSHDGTGGSNLVSLDITK